VSFACSLTDIFSWALQSSASIFGPPVRAGQLRVEMTTLIRHATSVTTDISYEFLLFARLYEG
jgi:hypothetical protein